MITEEDVQESIYDVGKKAVTWDRVPQTVFSKLNEIFNSKEDSITTLTLGTIQI